MNKLLTLLALLFCLNAFAQTSSTATPVYVIREHMKLVAGMEEDYLKIEALWKKVHQRRVSEGKIFSWTLFRRVVPYGSSNDYEYMTVTTFSSGKQLDDMSSNMSWAYIIKEMTPEEAILANSTEKTRSLVSSVWVRLLESVQPGGKYVELTYLDVPPGKGAELEKLEKMMKPVFTEMATTGKITAWRFGEVLYPYNEKSGGYYRVISTNTLDNMLSWNNNKELETAFNKVYPQKNFAETMKAFSDIITIKKVDLWEKVDGTN